MRFGRNWLIGDDGRKTTVVPRDLPVHLFWQWLRNRVIREAERSILERPFPTTEDVLDRPIRTGQPLRVVSFNADPQSKYEANNSDLLFMAVGDPLAMIIAQEEQDEAATTLRTVLDVASPQQRELLRLMYAGLSQADAARQLGMKPDTARGQMLRLRKKLM
jgi:RNA polymerase sigma factor (sigma-70 family)